MLTMDRDKSISHLQVPVGLVESISFGDPATIQQRTYLFSENTELARITGQMNFELCIGR